ncbi:MULTISPECIES: trypsin-like serine peptidase [unclassified Sphingomonas]|uniref:trypsin-like serine peptidase n=1 Tax=unclassified Sphingomonas TaxID=196159 RepID=UPI0006F626E9|nr:MULTISPECIES: trypsin-like peptidase domain-containing protein [unclassified Sphingomonas]KQX19599.1 hypothetical protein ASD17_13915 [Sphingomonas sp. Root1294]KQY65800.1 hypothetical protein ASD39_17115 [Sphingomonas sp. Root50]KRB94894.1 hypothetical protein ASE22_02940 [Sphingomonas sp. Root720]
MASSIPTGGARRILRRLSLLACLTAQLLALAPAAAMVLGTDERDSASAFLTADDESRFEGVGRIECLQPGTRGVSLHATGWIVGTADTVMTAAHTFFKPDANGERTIARDPGNCIFILFNRDQSIREIATVRYAVSPWAETRFRGDSARDFAVLKLSRAMKVSSIPSVAIAAGTMKPVVELVAFQSGVSQDQRARITQGEARRFPALGADHEIDGSRISNGSRLFSTSANSSPGSSGGLYYDRSTGAVLGVHLGGMCDPSARTPAYDPTRCFNYGLRFDRAMLDTIDSVARDAASSGQLIASDQPALLPASVVLAMAG